MSQGQVRSVSLVRPRAELLGAAVVIVGDMIPERLAQAKSFGCEVINLRQDATLAQQIEQILNEPVVDSAVDCVGFEAHGHGKDAATEQPATVLNALQEICRAGASIGIPGLYVTGDPGGVDEAAKVGGAPDPHWSGLGEILLVSHWSVPSAALQPPTYDGDLARQGSSRQGVQCDRPFRWTNAPQGYKDFDKGAAKKFVIDPHGTAKKAA